VESLSRSTLEQGREANVVIEIKLFARCTFRQYERMSRFKVPFEYFEQPVKEYLYFLIVSQVYLSFLLINPERFPYEMDQEDCQTF